MSTETFLFVINALTIGTLLLSIIYTTGVVWRVELELDTSYKFFLTATIFIFAAEVLSCYYAIDYALGLSIVVKILRMLFAVSFLAGVLFMRDIVRKMDGEIDDEK
jgi:hypothetical protein